MTTTALDAQMTCPDWCTVPAGDHLTDEGHPSAFYQHGGHIPAGVDDGRVTLFAAQNCNGAARSDDLAVAFADLELDADSSLTVTEARALARALTTAADRLEAARVLFEQ